MTAFIFSMEKDFVFSLHSTRPMLFYDFNCPEVVPRLPRGWSEFAPSLPRGCPEVAPRLPRVCPEVAPRLLRGCPEVALRLPRGCPEVDRGSPMVALRLPRIWNNKQQNSKKPWRLSNAAYKGDVGKGLNNHLSLNKCILRPSTHVVTTFRGGMKG